MDRRVVLKQSVLALVAAAAMTTSDVVSAYPLDAYPATGIERLEASRLANEGKLHGGRQPAGALLKTDQVDLRLADSPDFSIPPPDPDFTRKVVEQLGDRADEYNIAVLDLSDLAHPRYAEHNADVARNPGSVGKLLVALAMFQMLADLYPDSIDQRIHILKDTMVTADDFVISDHHTVRFYNPATGELKRHPLHPGDKGTLWQFMDWMVSASSNSAASQVMRELVLMAHFGKRYPVSDAEAETFLKTTPKSELSAIFTKAMQEPVTRNGLDITRFRQGGFFTRVGQSRIPGPNSYATPRELMHYVVKMEKGELVDRWSSREIKRLMYQTERRIRYATSPTLAKAAVYFKSGSLFRCERGHHCRAYEGDKENLMNSVAIVESPAGTLDRYYIVTLMSNVLGRNSASDHAALATRLDRLIEKLNARRLSRPASE